MSETTVFARPQSLAPVTTHYCPGCTHGVIHRLVAEVIDELGVRDRTVGVAPVGCSVLAYNYFNTDFHEASHGRAPAVATGIKRARPDLIVFTYQGDGDLASIGMAEIVHCANRGEKVTVVFVNNAIYGMTGGQMAPTTMPGQVATTCPLGRDVDPGRAPDPRRRDALDAAHAGVRGARLGPHAAARGHDQGDAAAGVPLPARRHLLLARRGALHLPDQLGDAAARVVRVAGEEHDAVLPARRVQGARRRGPGAATGGSEEDAMQNDVIIAGFGGQGVLLIGKMLAYAGMREGKEVSWLPSYGPEMRGGTANCTVVISDKPVGSPVVERPRAAMVLNLPSLDKFESTVKPGGLLVINSSLINRGRARTDVTWSRCRPTRSPTSSANPRGANMVALGAFLGATHAVSLEAVDDADPRDLRRQAEGDRGEPDGAAPRLRDRRARARRSGAAPAAQEVGA